MYVFFSFAVEFQCSFLVFQIVPQEMAENCFWIKVKEEKFENLDLFAQLSLTFSSKSRGKQTFFFLFWLHLHLWALADFFKQGNLD